MLTASMTGESRAFFLVSRDAHQFVINHDEKLTGQATMDRGFSTKKTMHYVDLNSLYSSCFSWGCIMSAIEFDFVAPFVCLL